MAKQRVISRRPDLGQRPWTSNLAELAEGGAEQAVAETAEVNGGLQLAKAPFSQMAATMEALDPAR